MKELKAPIRSPPALLSLPQRKQTNPETFGASFWWLRGRGSPREPPRVDTYSTNIQTLGRGKWRPQAVTVLKTPKIQAEYNHDI